MRMFIALALLATPLLANADELVGTWRFEKEVDIRANGIVLATLSAKDVHGYITYTADGFVSALLMPSNRNWRIETAPIEDLRASVENGTAYAGRYQVNPQAHTVRHIVAVSFEPAFEGRHLVRQYAVSGDTLTLSGSFQSKGETVSFTMTLVREQATP